ncbi:MAG: asparaginase [Pseudomonadales bacterium]|jgi:L-asparaginase|nr:asparaginase [Pseudomonadales bacterium]
MSLHILVTGGTFDKEYDAVSGQLCFNDTHLPQLLAQARCQFAFPITTLMLKDSLDLDDADREVIARACHWVSQQRIVLIHGTDTMTDTAEALVREGLGKTVVLTGAMVPYVFDQSDALFNLGSAMSLAQVLPAGVYIAMNGEVFRWDKVRKNRELGRFEAI